MHNPLVSVVIATYRRETDFSSALQSLATQTYDNYEIIVVDDNADARWNDKISAVVEKFRAKNKIPVKLIRNYPNLGSAMARNAGIKAASGMYVTFLDDDDVYLPDKISHQVRAVINANADFSIADMALYNEDGSVSEIRRRHYLFTDEKDNLLLCHLKYHMTGTGTLMFKRDYLMEIGCFDAIDVGDEYFLMMKAIEGNGTICYLPMCDMKACVHIGEGGLSSGRRKIEGENSLYEFKKKYFNTIKSKDIRYIKMRHYAVLAFAYRRSGKALHFFTSGVRSFLTAPVQCVKMLTDLGWPL